jgi:hypothetical protein
MTTPDCRVFKSSRKALFRGKYKVRVSVGVRVRVRVTLEVGRG